MGKCRGNLFPVRASSDTVPPLSGPGLCLSMLEANAVKTSSGRADARFYAHGRLYHGCYSYKSLITHRLTVGSRFPPVRFRPRLPRTLHVGAGLAAPSTILSIEEWRPFASLSHHNQFSSKLPPMIHAEEPVPDSACFEER